MGGKTTNQYITNITETGLGDSQYSGIMSGQGEIKTNQAGITSGIGALQSSQDTGFTGVQTGFDNLNTYLGEQFQGANDQRFDYAKANAEAQKYLNDQAIAREDLAQKARINMKQNTTEGFDAMGGRFDTVDTNVDDGFAAQEKGFRDMGEEFSLASNRAVDLAKAAQTDRDTQFTATGAALDQGFADTATGQANILEGQTGLGTTLGEMSAAQDTYAAQSLENQGNIQSGIDTAASTFDTYVDRYGEDQTLAQDTRNDLATAQSNFANKMSKDVAGYNQNVTRDLENLKGQVTTVADQQTAAAGRMAAAASQMANLDANTRANFALLGAAFNANGALISESVDDAGNVTRRDYDNQGNIVFTTFDGSGNQTGQKALAIQPSLNNLAIIQQGANAQMGSLSPGLGSPYAQTS